LEKQVLTIKVSNIPDIIIHKVNRRSENVEQSTFFKKKLSYAENYFSEGTRPA
jgi:hypothetical protein